MVWDGIRGGKGLDGILWRRVKTAWQVVLTLAAPDYTGNLPVLLCNDACTLVITISWILGWGLVRFTV